MSNPHLQTLFAQYDRADGLSLERQRIKVPLTDGDHVLLDSHKPVKLLEKVPLTLIIHGLSGSSESHYVLGLQKALSAMGWPSIAMNCRGATSPNDRVRAYHAGASDDVIGVFNYLITVQERPIVIVGYSLGGSMTLKSLAELGNHPRLLGGVAVSTPLHLASCADRLDRGFSRLYRKHLLSEMDSLWRNKLGFLQADGRHAEAAQIRSRLATGPFSSFWDFDNRVMAPLHGYQDVHDYYARCTPNQFLRQIVVPTLVIHAKDDPFMQSSVVPQASELSPSIHFELSPTGGHVGFISGSLTRPIYYLEKRIPQFLSMLHLQSDASLPCSQ